MNIKMFIVMLGAPGTGKGTIGGILEKELGIVRISSGDIFRTYVKKDKEIRALDIHEQKQLTEYLINSSTVDEPYKTAFLIEMYMGLRIGEILALNSKNVNLRSNYIHVEPTIIRDENGNPKIKNTPKTKKSIRNVPIPEIIKNEIIEQIKLADCHKEQLLFVSNTGGYVNPPNANHVLKRICKQLNIENVTSHSLRHTFATRCIESGMKPLALKELMGHSSVSITLDVYTSVFNKYRDSELENLNTYYKNSGLFVEPNIISKKGNIINDNSLTVYIKRLRQKIEDDINNPSIIKTIKGVGYKI